MQISNKANLDLIAEQMSKKKKIRTHTHIGPFTVSHFDSRKKQTKTVMSAHDGTYAYFSL